MGVGLASLAAVLALAAAAILCVLRPLSILLPGGGLDASWAVVLGEAATHHARWGVDLAFTYGPASAWVTRYFTDDYLASALPDLAGVAVVNGLALVLLARRAAAGRRFGALTIFCAVSAQVAALAALLALDQDSFYFTLALLLLLLDLVRAPRERVATATVLAGAALLGSSALGKTSFGIVGLILLSLADARASFAERRLPALAPAFLVAALATFLLQGQRLSDLPAYLDLQGQVASGYGEAMYLAPQRFELALFLCAATLLTVVAGLFGPRGRGGRGTAALGTALVLAIGLKAGFVRADTHTQIAWSLLGLAGVSVAIGLVLHRSVIGAATLALSSLAVLWIVGPLFLLGADDRPPRLATLPDIYRLMGADLAAETGAWSRFWSSPSRFAAAARAAKSRSWDELRAAQPLPPLDGGVDMLPSEQSRVLAAGLDYRPRPSFQEYSTYTAGLIAANRAFYAGQRAPDWVIFGGGALDDRYPASTEGALWPELLRRYEPQRFAGPWLALHRRAVPLPDVLGPPTRLEATLGQRVPLPFSGPVFARVTLGKSILGRLAAALFRPPALSLRVTLAGGDEQNYRFVPAMADGGFLLSPMVTDAAGFAGLAFGQGPDAEGTDVTALTVGGSRWARFFYHATLSIELRPVTVPAVPPSAEAAALAGDVARPLPWRRLTRAIGRGGQLDEDRLSVPAPTALSIPVASARHLHLGFGIVDGAWTDGGSEGVCFAIKATPDAAAPLWRRCLDPKSVTSDRGAQSAEVELPPGLATVSAETSCLKSCAWGWSYWNDIAPSK